MIRCPHCDKEVLVFLDIPGENSTSVGQPAPTAEGQNKRHCYCGTCQKHTGQVKAAKGAGYYKWHCTVCNQDVGKVRAE